MRGPCLCEEVKSEMMRVFQEFFAVQPIEDLAVKVICILSLGTINITNAFEEGALLKMPPSGWRGFNNID